nr:MAG TPA: hypothetical protein [Caudoviricetes sp.]
MTVYFLLKSIKITSNGCYTIIYISLKITNLIPYIHF